MTEFVDIDMQTAEEALSYCDFNDRDDWVHLGMALRSEFGDAAFDMWDAWSRRYSPAKKTDRYNTKKGRSTWNGFRGRGYNIGTLIKLSKAGGYTFNRPERSSDEMAQIQAERDKRLLEQSEREAREEAAEQAWRLRLSDFLISHLDKFQSDGYSAYLAKKKCPAFGLMFPSQSMVMVTDQEQDLLEIYVGADEVRKFFQIPKDEQPKFRYLKRDTEKGVALVPLVDIDGRLWNMQILYSDGGKSFFPGRKSGCFHLLGQIPAFGKFNICEVEGYSNGAPIHMALGCPVLIAFDAGNLKPVAQDFCHKYSNSISRFAVCGDDDQHLIASGKKNKGREDAEKTALAIGGLAVFPSMTESPSPPSEPPEADNAQEIPDADPLFDDAVKLVREEGKVSYSFVQRSLKIGYNRACHIVEQMERDGIVTEQKANGRRAVIGVE